MLTTTFFLSGGVEKDIIDPPILSSGNTNYFQDNIHNYEVAEYNLDSDVGELCINTSGAAYILPSRVKIVIPNEISCDMNKISCRVSKYSNKFKLNPTDQLLSPIVDLTPNGSKFSKPLRISIPYHYTACDKQTREIVMRVTTAYTNGLLRYEDLNSKLINAVEDANSSSGEVVSFVTHFCRFGVISRLKKDHVSVENEQPTVIVSSVDSSTKLLFPKSSVVNRTEVTITVLKIDDADVKNIVMCDHCPVSNVLQVSVSPKNTVFQNSVTVTLALPKSLIGRSFDKKMLRLVKSSNESEDWQDITAEVELKYKTEYVAFQVKSLSSFCLVGKDLEIDNLPKVMRRTITHEVRFLAMQQKPSLVLAQCVRRDLVDERIKKLREMEYYGNDPCTAVHDFVEGQRFKVKVFGDIKVKSNDENEKKFIEEDLVKQFHSQHDSDESGYCKFHIEPNKAASRTNSGNIRFFKVFETVCHAPETNGIYENGNICGENRSSENERYIDHVPITLESAVELSEVAKHESETDIFREICWKIASEIGRDWAALAWRLGMTEGDLDCIKTKCPNNLKDQSYTMVNEWYRKNAKNAEWLAKLVKALNDAGRTDLAKEVEDMYEKEKKRLETQKNGQF